MFLRKSSAVLVSLLVLVEAGYYSLPITRKTVGISFGVFEVNKQIREDRLQNVLRGQAVHTSYLSEWEPRGQHALFANKRRRPLWFQNQMNDDDDDDIEAMYWSMYTTPIGVGNPPLHMDAIVDTSWSPMFIPSVNCTYDPKEVYSCLVHPLYNSSLSGTYRADLTPSSLLYSGSAGIYTQGKKSYDSFHVAGMEITEQAFEEVTWWRPDYGTRDEFFDTVLGLALFQTLDGDRWGNFTTKSPFRGMMEQRLLDENLIALQLARNDYEKGEITLGGLPHGLRREQMIEIPLNHSKVEDGDELWRFYTMNGWQVSVERMSMALDSCEDPVTVLDRPQIAVVSSSFPWIGLPDSVADTLNKAIGLQVEFDWLDCDMRSHLSNWTIAFGRDQAITLTPWDYLIEVYDDLHDQLKCVSAFMGLDKYGDKGFILLGAPFLNGLYSVFDADRESISFSNRPL